jgi:bifunctional pyridoxal-dependent enzyme with beta-cystathionase and maltose regulon repressor activities
MVRTTSAEQESKVQELAMEIASMSTEVIQEVAEILNATPDREIFGDTEFVVRTQVLKIVAKAFTARLAQKKTAMSVPPSLVPIVNDRLSSKVIETESL